MDGPQETIAADPAPQQLQQLREAAREDRRQQNYKVRRDQAAESVPRQKPWLHEKWAREEN